MKKIKIYSSNSIEHQSTPHKSRAASLNAAPLVTPTQTRRQHSRKGRSKSVCSTSLHVPIQPTNQTSNSRKNSVISISEHFSSLLSISSQVTDQCFASCLNIYLSGRYEYWRKGGSSKKITHTWWLDWYSALQNKKISQIKVSLTLLVKESCPAIFSIFPL